MIKKSLLIGAALAVSFGASAGPNKGDWEIVFSTMGGSLEVTDGDFTLDAGVRAGYFFTQKHELGLAANLRANDDDETLGLGGFYRYNMQNGEQKNWWFFGVDLDIDDVEEAGDTLYLRPHVGHKWMLSNDVAFDIDGGIRIDADDSDADETIGINFGLTIFF